MEGRVVTSGKIGAVLAVVVGTAAALAERAIAEVDNQEFCAAFGAYAYAMASARDLRTAGDMAGAVGMENAGTEVVYELRRKLDSSDDIKTFDSMLKATLIYVPATVGKSPTSVGFEVVSGCLTHMKEIGR